MRRAQWNDALRCFQLAIDLEPDSQVLSQLHLQRACCHLKKAAMEEDNSRDLKYAFRACRKALKSDADNVDAGLMCARALTWQQEWQAASDAFDQTITAIERLDPTATALRGVKLRCHVGRALVLIGQGKCAISEIKKATDLRCRDTEVFHSHLLSLHGTALICKQARCQSNKVAIHFLEQAKKCFARADELCEARVQFYRCEGLLCSRRSQWAQSISFFETALTHLPLVSDERYTHFGVEAFTVACAGDAITTEIKHAQHMQQEQEALRAQAESELLAQIEQETATSRVRKLKRRRKKQRSKNAAEDSTITGDQLLLEQSPENDTYCHKHHRAMCPAQTGSKVTESSQSKEATPVKVPLQLQDCQSDSEIRVQIMVDHFVEEFKSQYNKDPSTCARAMHRLRTACVRATKELSSTAVVSVEVDSLFAHLDLHTSISRVSFEESCNKFKGHHLHNHGDCELPSTPQQTAGHAKLNQLDDGSIAHLSLNSCPQVEELHSNLPNASNLDDDLICPITQERFKDPVVTSDGFTYERDAIAQWLQIHDTSPMTNEPLLRKSLTPNMLVRRLLNYLG